MPEEPHKLPDFVSWPSFPFEGDLRVKPLEPVVSTEPPRQGEDASDCPSCAAPDEAYVWVSERWRVRATERPSGLPMVLILESRSHLDLGDLSNLLAAELGVMTVRLERAIRSLEGVARVHVNRWGDGSAHLHLCFLARPAGRLQLRGSFLSLWEDILPPVDESLWRENLALVAAWLAEFGGRALAEPPRINWQAPSTLARLPAPSLSSDETQVGAAAEAPGGTKPVVGQPRTDDGGTPSTPVSDAAKDRGGDAAAAGGDAGAAKAQDSSRGPSRQAATVRGNDDNSDRRERPVDGSGTTSRNEANEGNGRAGAVVPKQVTSPEVAGEQHQVPSST